MTLCHYIVGITKAVFEKEGYTLHDSICKQRQDVIT